MDSEERPLCKCHGEPCYYKKKNRPGGGYWYCPVKAREASRRYREKNPDKIREASRRYREKNPEYVREYYKKNRENIREQFKEYWHRADGGYIKRRKRHLSAQRASLVEQLHQIEEEISLVVES